MKLLKDRILQDGQCFEGGVLKVDSFINHGVVPDFEKDEEIALLYTPKILQEAQLSLELNAL